MIVIGSSSTVRDIVGRLGNFGHLFGDGLFEFFEYQLGLEVDQMFNNAS